MVNDSEKSTEESLLFNQNPETTITPDAIPSYPDILFNTHHQLDKSKKDHGVDDDTGLKTDKVTSISRNGIGRNSEEYLGDVSLSGKVDTNEQQTTTPVAEDLTVNNATEEHKEKHAYVPPTRPENPANSTTTFIDDSDHDDSYFTSHDTTTESSSLPTAPSGGLSEQKQADTKHDTIGDQMETTKTATSGPAPMSKNAKRRKRMLRELGNVEIKTNPRKIKRLSSPLSHIIDKATTTSSSSSAKARGRGKTVRHSHLGFDGPDDSSDDQDEYEVEAIRRHRTYRVSDIIYE